jgi:hypothetical protein
MNIESLVEKISLFNEMVIESGFMRDIEAYRTAIAQPQTQTNLVALKEIASKLIESLEKIHNTSLPGDLDILLPNKTVFTENDNLENLEGIMNDPEIDTTTFFSTLTTELNQLFTQITADRTELEKLNTVFSVYVDKDKEQLNAEDIAIMAIVFRDLSTIKSLKKFARALDKWNRTLFIYHQLVTSESPADIEIVEIQNGSIDVVFNIDANVAIDLAQVFKIAFFMFSAYLTYKTNLHQIIPDALMGNKKMIEIEDSREKLLLEEIKAEVIKKLKEQHKERRRTDKNIDTTSLTSKYEEISSIVLDHIVKGNDIKLLSAPKDESENTDDENTSVKTDLSRELRDKSQEVQSLMNQLPASDVKLLAEKYEIKDETEEQ